MNKADIVSLMKSTFTEEELAAISIFAGAALVMHDCKEDCGDIDCNIIDYKIFEQISNRHESKIRCHSLGERGVVCKIDLLNNKNQAIELFYNLDSVYKHKYRTDTYERDEVLIDGLKVDGPAALFNWYSVMIEERGLEKDHYNYQLARKLFIG